MFRENEILILRKFPNLLFVFLWFIFGFHCHFHVPPDQSRDKKIGGILVLFSPRGADLPVQIGCRYTHTFLFALVIHNSDPFSSSLSSSYLATLGGKFLHFVIFYSFPQFDPQKDCSENVPHLLSFWFTNLEFTNSGYIV